MAEPARTPRPLPTAAELLGATVLPLAFTPPAPFVPCNPSIHFDGWRWRCSIRTVDYSLGKPALHGSSSVNYLATLDARLQVSEVREMVDRSGMATQTAMVRGFEDLRLYSVGDDLRALATCCEVAGGEFRDGVWGLPELVRLRLTPEGTITHAHPLRGAWSSMPQKNWMPVQDGSGRVVYRTLPRLVLELEDAGPDKVPSVVRVHGDTMAWIPSSLRGSSQLLFFDAGRPGYLAVCHESTRRPLAYRHRFVWFDTDLVPRMASRDFVWLAPGVEFCAGLATDGRRLVGSFGVNDCEAKLAVMDPAAVRAQLRPLAY